MPERSKSLRIAKRKSTTPNLQECLNIKVYARFRPLNQMENELTQNGLGNECTFFPDNYTVLIQPDNIIHTYDRTFSPATTQQEVYEVVGKEAINDVLQGYNGTIFAYGQTGSGKTHTMFGELRNAQNKGIIPRSMQVFVWDNVFSQSIFNYIQNSESDFILTCSMLEIYKENLFDLLSINRPDLRIKENPKKGIYVENLTQLSLTNQEELLHVVELGEQTRKVAATRINQISSRSHTIFMLEISQKDQNDTEHKGKLNLVDLAGSEKVGKTGAMGEILEEAKKINLSLSCLGNVIHALTTNNEHIPYRNSKLTRILQESLGGNYKTSLIVTCSSHSSSLEETISTLKFASRTKSIKNHFKMNVKLSSEMMQSVINELKRELLSAQHEIECLKKRSILEIPSEDASQTIYDASQLSNQSKMCFKKKNSSLSTPSNEPLSEIKLKPQTQQTSLDLSFLSPKKNDLKHHLLLDQLTALKDQELAYVKAIDDLKLKLHHAAAENDKKAHKLALQDQKIHHLQTLLSKNKQKEILQENKPQPHQATIPIEYYKMLLDENAFLNKQVHILTQTTDQDNYLNSLLREKLEAMNMEYFKKIDAVLSGEVSNSRVTRIIGKNKVEIEQLTRNVSLQSFISLIVKIVAQDSSSWEAQVYEQLARNKAKIEEGLVEMIRQYEKLRQKKNEPERQLEIMQIEMERMNEKVFAQGEQISLLQTKNEKMQEMLRSQNLVIRNKLSKVVSPKKEDVEQAKKVKPPNFFRYDYFNEV